MRNTLSRTLPAAICLAVLAACGGGGDGATDTGPKASAGSDINATNYQSFAAPLANAVLDVGGGASVSEVFSAPGGARAASAVRRALGIASSTGRATVQSVRRLTVSQETQPCDHAGTLTISINDANNNQTLDVGDSISFTANGCQFSASDQPMNGGFAMTLQQLQLDNQNNLRSLQVSGSFTNLSIGSDSLNGGYQFSLALNADGSETLQMGFNNMSATHSGQTVTYNVTLNASTAPNGNASFSINGTVKPGAETYLLKQVQNFSVTAGAEYPSSGSLRMEDAAGDALVIEAKPGNVVDFKFYPAGASLPNQQLLSQPWSGIGG